MVDWAVGLTYAGEPKFLASDLEQCERQQIEKLHRINKPGI